MAPAPPPDRTTLSLEDAVSLACGRRLEPSVSETPLHKAAGRVLAIPVFAEEDDPRFDASAMDGWAIRAEDGEAGTELQITGEAFAGALTTTPPVNPGCAVRIMTGAEPPPGTDLIAPVEIAEEIEDSSGITTHIRLLQPASDHIRKRGENLRVGDQVLAKGVVLTPPRLSLAAATGNSTLHTIAPFEVAIIPTGDEVVPVESLLREGQIYESNSIALASALQCLGHDTRILPIVGDDRAATRAALDNASSSDLIITSGGVSMGDADHVRSIMESEGEIDFWRIRIKPGGPPLFGAWRGTPMFGLPGNPVSTQVVFTLLVRPWLAYMQGAAINDPNLTSRRVPVILGEPFRTTKGKRTFHRVRLNRRDNHLIAHAPTHQGSGNSLSMALADALLDLPPDGESDAGDQATALLLE